MNSDILAHIYIILASQEINEALRSGPLESRQFLISLSVFLKQLNIRVKAYKELFGYPTLEVDEIDETLLRKLILESEISSLVSFGDESLKIEVVPHKFQSFLTGILVDSSIRYSKALVRQVDDLTEKYNELNSRPQAEVKADVSIIDADENSQNMEQGVETTKAVLTGERDLSDNTSEGINAAVSEDATTYEKLNVKQEVNASDNDLEDNEEQELANEHEEDEKAYLSQPDLSEVQKEEKVPSHPQEEDSVTAEGVPQGLVGVKEANADGEALDKEMKPEVPAAGSTSVSKTLLPKGGSDDNDAMKENTNKRSRSPLVHPYKHKRFQNIAINLIKSIEEHRFSSPFLTPVVADNYQDIVHQPKDLKSILRAVKQKEEPAPYATVKELERDIMLMFANCVMYNKASMPIVKMAMQMKNDVRNTFKIFEEAESEIS